jgi:outer membrane protein assembly factor BamB
MTNISDSASHAGRLGLRLWPGVAIASLMLVARYLLPLVWTDGAMIGVIGGVAGALAIVVWWLGFSRAPWPERIGVLVLLAIGFAATTRLIDRSIATGMMGMMFPIYAIPTLSIALVAWAAASRSLSSTARRALMIAAVVLACGVWTLLRTDGITGGGMAELTWRWNKTAEEKLLAESSRELPVKPEVTPAPAPAMSAAAPAPSSPAAPVAPTPQPIEAATAPKAAESVTAAAPAPIDRTPAEWPGFRGPKRDGIVRGVHISTDWAASPPVQLWRRPIGPGWSSFAVRGDVIYTQEQRGDSEVVAAYRKSTGEPVWRHRDPVRFWESNGGAGPRGTPTVSDGRVYAFGATGILNALDAATGAPVWSRNVAADSSTKVPMWGFSSSPVVVDDVVAVAASGKLVGYDVATGKLRWIGPPHTGSYSSPQVTTLDGVTQILMLSAAGATSVAPADGKILWEYAWPGSTIVQPALVDDGVLISTSGNTGGLGTRRLAVSRESSQWTVAERWTSAGLKPYFNDFVVHKGYAFGFDGAILACIDLSDGQRKWKGGRYGNGQLVLLNDQDVLLVLSEEGELVLVGAVPDGFSEIARVPAIEGKTWNHPVVVGDIVLVRNGQEMAAFKLPGGSATAY